MSNKVTLFYRKEKAFHLAFDCDATSSDGGLILLDKIEHKTKCIKSFGSVIPDNRDPSYIDHPIEKLLRQRVFMLAMGYEDCNDSDYLKHDVLLQQVLGGEVCSQPTLSRFENSIGKHTLWALAEWWINRYVESLAPGQEEVIIDVDCTDDPTHGAQQLSCFHGYYWQWMYNEMFFLDGKTGQMILPVLRPGNVHSSKWMAKILVRIVKAIRKRFPHIRIIVRADAGYSGAAFYQMAEEYALDFCLGIATNNRLESFTREVYNQAKEQYGDKGIKHQEFVGPFNYQADSWDKPQATYVKIESTGKGMNVRYFVSNMHNYEVEDLYWNFYVQRGETAENRIKEIKNFCFSDRLSCHSFWANYFRLMLSCLAYELLRTIRVLIRKTHRQYAWKWNMQSIRLYLLKVAAQIKERVRYVIINLSKTFTQQNLMKEIIALC